MLKTDLPRTAEQAARRWIAAQRGLAHRPIRAIDHANAAAIGAALVSVRPALPDTGAASAVADCVEAGVQNGWEPAVAREQSHLVRLRHTPAARERLEAFLKRG